MFGDAFLEKLREKYKYDNKTIKALSKIIPSMIHYYGEDYEDIILSAIFDCEIISCNSHQTISKVLRERTLTKMIGESFVSDIDVKRSESVYFPNVKISYNDKNNSYEIDKIDRVIVTSHTFNYDSLKGLEVLTHALCHLVKSYNNEFIIDENYLVIRSGISSEKRKIIYDEEIFLDLVSDNCKGLEEGFNLYDTEKIVSSIYKDSYKCYDFDSIYTVASIIKNKYELKKEINDYEIKGDIKAFENKYGEEVINKLGNICDKCVNLENDMYLSFSREDKDKCAQSINKILSEDMYNLLVSIYESRKKVKNQIS